MFQAVMLTFTSSDFCVTVINIFVKAAQILPVEITRTEDTHT